MVPTPLKSPNKSGDVIDSPYFCAFNGKAIYVSQPRQTIFHQAVDHAEDHHGPRHILYGGAAGGGKTEALVWILWLFGNDKRFRNLKIGVFRKTFPEVEKYFITRCLESFPNPEQEPIYKYRQKDHTLRFHATGCTVQFNYCENDIDVIRYQGAQFDILIIDELTHHSEYVFKYLKTRLRNSAPKINPTFRPIFIASTNPGGLGHAFTKRLWIDKDDYGHGEGTKDDYTFIPSRVYDNYALMKVDPEYVMNLEALPEMDRRALLEGDWNIFAGQYFTEVRNTIQMFEPFLIPSHWTRFISFDYGFFPHPASVGWYAVSEQGTVFRYKELLIQRLTIKQLAKKMVEMTTEDEAKMIEYIVGSAEIFAKKGTGSGKSGAEEMQAEFDANAISKKWVLWMADTDRLNGWYLCREFLKPVQLPAEYMTIEKQYTSRFQIARTCFNWWKQIPQLQHDENKPEDLRKTGVTEAGKIWGGDDIADEMRYALMSRFSRTKNLKGKEKVVDRYGVVRPSRKGYTYRKPEIHIQKPDYVGHP